MESQSDLKQVDLELKTVRERLRKEALSTSRKQAASIQRTAVFDHSHAAPPASSSLTSAGPILGASPQAGMVRSAPEPDDDATDVAHEVASAGGAVTGHVETALSELLSATATDEAALHQILFKLSKKETTAPMAVKSMMKSRSKAESELAAVNCFFAGETDARVGGGDHTGPFIGDLLDDGGECRVPGCQSSLGKFSAAEKKSHVVACLKSWAAVAYVKQLQTAYLEVEGKMDGQPSCPLYSGVCACPHLYTYSDLAFHIYSWMLARNIMRDDFYCMLGDCHTK